MIKHIEIEHNPCFILFGINFMDYEGDDGSEGYLLSIGLLFVNINIYL